MIAKLKKVLYTVDELHPDGDVVVQVADDDSIQAWSISQFRASRVIARGKHEFEKMAWAVPACVLRNAKSLGEALERNKISALPLGDWRVETLRSLEEAEKVALAIARVSDLRSLTKLYARSMAIYELYCELVIGEESIECTGELGKVVIPAELTLPGRIGLNTRYLAEAVKNLIARDKVGIAMVRFKGTHILMLASEHERHYIAEMRKKR
jgi:hypothetical protein